MKWAYKIVLVILFFLFGFYLSKMGAVNNKATEPCEYYALSGVITVLDFETDTVTIEDAVGHKWSFSGCEDYEVGYVVSCVVNDNGTEIVFDDQIVNVRFSGYANFQKGD